MYILMKRGKGKGDKRIRKTKKKERGTHTDMEKYSLQKRRAKCFIFYLGLMASLNSEINVDWRTPPLSMRTTNREIPVVWSVSKTIQLSEGCGWPKVPVIIRRPRTGNELSSVKRRPISVISLNGNQSRRFGRHFYVFKGSFSQIVSNPKFREHSVMYFCLLPTVN